MASSKCWAEPAGRFVRSLRVVKTVPLGGGFLTSPIGSRSLESDDSVMSAYKGSKDMPIL